MAGALYRGGWWGWGVAGRKARGAKKKKREDCLFVQGTRARLLKGLTPCGSHPRLCFQPHSVSHPPSSVAPPPTPSSPHPPCPLFLSPPPQPQPPQLPFSILLCPYARLCCDRSPPSSSAVPPPLPPSLQFPPPLPQQTHCWRFWPL